MIPVRQSAKSQLGSSRFQNWKHIHVITIIGFEMIMLYFISGSNASIAGIHLSNKRKPDRSAPIEPTIFDNQPKITKSHEDE